jgi:hypothetical protein
VGHPKGWPAARLRARDHGALGVEVQVYRERGFLYDRRWASRALAIEEADAQKAAYLAKGGVLIA